MKSNSVTIRKSLFVTWVGGIDLFREIKKKKLILENRKPFTREVANYIDELNLVDWVYTALKLDGSGISKPSVQKIIKGDFVVDVTVRDHSSIVNYLEAIKLANDMSYMSIELNENIYFDFINPYPNQKS